MKVKKKNILINAVFLCILLTAYILFEIMCLKNQLTILNIITRYGVAIITGILFEIYCELISTSSIYEKFNKKRGYLSLLIVSMFSGVVFYGMGMGIFLFIIFTFLLGNPITISNFILIFLTGLICGAVFGLIMFIILSLINIIKKRNSNLKKH